VFQRQPWGWQQTQTLEASDPKPKNKFGHSLALDGDTLAVGAYRVGELNVKGAVYMFERQPDGTWVEVQKIASTDTKVWGLGWSVALEGDELIAGAVGAVALGDGAGRVLFYERGASGWVWKNTYPSPDSKAGDNFGTSLAIDGNSLVVGADQANAPPWQGHAYVYERYPLAWIYKATLTPSDLPATNDFGHDVAISGGAVLVGARGVQVGTGAVYVFDLTGGSWTESTKLLASDGHVTQYFGDAVDLEGDLAVIGAFGDDDLGKYSGAAYVFERHAGIWTESSKFHGSGLVEYDTFGYSGIDLDGEDLLVGAPAAASDATTLGSAYFFTFAPGPHLTADTDSVSLSQGGSQALQIGACPEHAGDLYFLAGSATGTSPGFAFGGVPVPLNPDVYFLYTVNHPGSPPLAASLGVLDAGGKANIAFSLPPGSAATLAGLTLNHAYAVLDPATLQLEVVSPAVPVALLP
jgi:hypothetical protein